MNTPKPAGIDLSSLHQVFQAALAPFVQPRHQYGNVTYSCEQHMRDDIERDRKALAAQMQDENSRTNFGEIL